MIIAFVLITFLVLVLIRVPVGFAMGGASVAALVAYPALGIPMVMVPRNMVSSVDSFVLLAVPLFILAGFVMEASGIAGKLLDLARVMVGHLRGGLGQIVVVSEMFFSGISGSTVADVSAISSMVLPSMKNAGYKKEQSVAIISAASAMGILIPPCINMVVMGGMVSISVAALFFAGFLPAFVLASLIMMLLAVQARKQGVKALPRATVKEFMTALRKALIPLGMPIIIFGGIMGGVMTPTESAAVAVLYSVVVGFVFYRTLTLKRVFDIAVLTGVLTGAVLLMVQMATMFAQIMAIEQLPLRISDWILSISSAPWFFLLITALIFIVIGSLLEGLPAMIIFIPILLPVALIVGVDPLHWATIVIAALGIGMFIPPTGVGLIIACSVADCSIEAASRALVPLMGALIAGLVVLIFIPEITLIVPRALGMWE
jgi:tripartite ATP-independent transporter DctM subunit